MTHYGMAGAADIIDAKAAATSGGSLYATATLSSDGWAFDGGFSHNGLVGSVTVVFLDGVIEFVIDKVFISPGGPVPIEAVLPFSI